MVRRNRHDRTIHCLSQAVAFVFLVFASQLASAKTTIDAALPEVRALLIELSPPSCFLLNPKPNGADQNEVSQIAFTSGEQFTKDIGLKKKIVDLTKVQSSDLVTHPVGTRLMFSPVRILTAVNALAEVMTDFEPICAHSIEQRAAVIERSMIRLSQRLESSTEALSKAARSMVAFDSETLAIIEALHLPAAGTMVDKPKTLPSPAHFGRQLVQFRSDKVAALIHALGGDLAQPRAASRELNIPLVVLDLDKAIPSTVVFSVYLEKFYEAVLAGLGVQLAPDEAREP